MSVHHILVINQDENVYQTVVDAMRISDKATEVVLHFAERNARIFNVLATGNTLYDVVVMSWEASSGPAELTALAEGFPYTAFVVWSASDSLLIPQQAFAAGASGFFRHDSPALLIWMVISLVLGGEAFALPGHLRSPASSF